MSHATQHRGAARRKTHSRKKKDDDGALEALFLFLSRGRRNDKTFLVFRRQASHSILSNFIRERRRTRSYIGRKDISCSCRELREVEEGFLAVLGVCQHSQQGVQQDILAQSISKPAEQLVTAQPCMWRRKDRQSVWNMSQARLAKWLPERFNMSRFPLRKIEAIDGPHNDNGERDGMGRNKK